MEAVVNDQAWALIIGAATVVALRIVDFFFPRGKWFTWFGNIGGDKKDADEIESDD